MSPIIIVKCDHAENCEIVIVKFVYMSEGKRYLIVNKLNRTCFSVKVLRPGATSLILNLKVD